ncbi:MAG: ABC transporter ATP-binding protein [Bacteroidota bacterium]
MTTSTNAGPLIQLEQVYKFHFTDTLQTAALNGLDIRIESGEFVSIMGPSGSGKSTLLNILGMIDKPTRGKYFFRGQEVHALSKRKVADLRKSNISFVFQSFNLIDELTSYENVELPLIYQGVSWQERRERTEAALAELEMLHRRDHYPSQLSGGQQQRVAIARAIVTRPALILADEPTGNLDSENSRIVMQKLQELHGTGSTIVMVTHAKSDADYAERTVELFDGNILMTEKEYAGI